jgi:hypothetical protein
LANSGGVADSGACDEFNFRGRFTRRLRLDYA